MVAGSFGRRASNSSAMRGRPPVISRVLYACRGILVTVMPFATLTGGLRKTVLSFASFLVFLGHASLIGPPSTWDFVLHGLAPSRVSMARLPLAGGEPRNTPPASPGGY